MIHGVLNVYKEKGYTSHDVVAKLRGIVKQKKIGHTGTLDPDAEGVLPVCFGKATKLCDLLTDKDKTYQAVLLLGQVTDTQDTSGQVLEKHSTEDLTNEKVENVIRSFEGEYDQIPPMYSALKVNGKKLYELAREGKEVERKARRITIHEIRILEINLPEVKLEVTCSKGTYIRTLCHDIGQKFGCGAAMKSLLRLQAAGFVLDGAHTLDEIQSYKAAGSLAEVITPVEQVFSVYPVLTAKPVFDMMLKNGNKMAPEQFAEYIVPQNGMLVRVRMSDGRFAAVYEYQETLGLYRPSKMFLED